jgi:hypothetical protein
VDFALRCVLPAGWSMLPGHLRYDGR